MNKDTTIRSSFMLTIYAEINSSLSKWNLQRNLKTKCRHKIFLKVTKEFGTMPFNLRNMEDEKKARMGVLECVSHKLIEPFQVLYEKEGRN